MSGLKKRQVAAKIEDIADDLLELYAKREAQQGYVFPPDDHAQIKFDDSFGYPETPDQIRSIEEIKVDMQKLRPMDRLLVGDVGFEKLRLPCVLFLKLLILVNKSPF